MAPAAETEVGPGGDDPAGTGPENSERLGRSYEALLGQEIWEVDISDSVAAAGAAEAGGRPAPPAPADPPPLARIVEAMLFVGGAPLTPERACDALRGLTPAQFLEVIGGLNRAYRQQGRPYRIQPQERGYALALHRRYRPVLDKLYGTAREARLSPAAVDVLALVAYRQPATKQEIDSLRGADSGALLRQLVRRGLVAVVGRADAAQREVSYGTTPRFLQLFRLRSLDDLPQTQDLQRL
jgi:segregation and condensation protein B